MLLLTLLSFFFYIKGLVRKYLFNRPTNNRFVKDLPIDVLSYNLCKREKKSLWKRFWPNLQRPQTRYFGLNVFPGLFTQPAEDLSSAQKHMMRKMAKDLKLTSGIRILDLGCFSPAFISYLSKNFDVYIDGLTSSPSRYHMCRSLDLTGCNFYLTEYEDFNSPLPYHRIYSSTPFINQDKEFLEKIKSDLIDDGYFLFFLLCGKSIDPWLNQELGLLDKEHNLVLGLPDKEYNLDSKRLVLSRLEDLTTHYDKTLLLKSWLCTNILGYHSLGLLSGCLRARKMLLHQYLLKRQEI